jgi:hypothetical protein
MHSVAGNRGQEGRYEGEWNKGERREGDEGMKGIKGRRCNNTFQSHKC